MVVSAVSLANDDGANEFSANSAKNSISLNPWEDSYTPTISALRFWLEMHIVPARRYKKVVNQLREFAINALPRSKYRLTDDYAFHMNREFLDNKLGRAKQGTVHSVQRATSNRPVSNAGPKPTGEVQGSYEYTDLGPSSFRYFIMMPGGYEDPLIGSLVTAELSDDVQYDAVSHRWGSFEDAQVVFCDRKRIVITREVDTMLRNLRQPSQRRMLWIDHICIDQSNDEEKDQQVKIMDSIFRNANSTIIWHGSSNEMTPIAFDFLEALHVILEKYYRDNRELNGFSDIDIQTDCNIPISSDMRWEALEDLLTHAWYTRAWTVQELMLSKNPWIQCGKFCFPAFVLERIVLVLGDSLMIGRRELLVQSSYAMARLHADFSGSSLTLLVLLAVTRSKTATHAKDKVWSILGLASDKDEFRELLDYRDTPETSFMKVATYYLARGEMVVLNHAGRGGVRNLRTLPTWVPDWSNNLSQVGGMFIAKSDPAFEDRVSSNESRTITNHLSAKINGATLMIQAIIIDRIDATGRTVTSMNNAIYNIASQAAFTWFEHWRYLGARSPTYPTGEDSLEAFARTIVGNRDLDLKELSYADTYALCVQRFRRPNSVIHRDPEIIFRYLEAVKETCRGKCFFVTRSRYIGIGPYFVQRGDLVVHIQGCLTPFLVRKGKNDQYTLVGSAYVHGKMDTTHEQSLYKEMKLI